MDQSRKRTIVTRMMFGALVLGVPLISATAESSREEKRLNTLSGEIQFEDSIPGKSYKEVAREAANEWIDQLFGSVSSPAPKPVPALSHDAAFYLSALYLYCMSKSGPCPAVLEAVFESDVISTGMDGRPNCGNSIVFWREWLQHDMEDRAKYLLAVGTATRIAAFNKQERPKFIKCKESAEAVVRLPDSQKAARYGSAGTATAYVSRVKDLLHDIESGSVDIFQSIGLKVADRAEEK